MQSKQEGAIIRHLKKLFCPNNQRTFHVLMDVTAEDIAHKDKSADFVGFERYEDRLTWVYALCNINTEGF